MSHELANWDTNASPLSANPPHNPDGSPDPRELRSLIG